MEQTSIRLQVCMAMALFASFVPRDAKADGGIIRLRETQGPFSVTLFSSPDAVAGGLVDVSVLIQRRETGKVILDADVSFTLSPPDGLTIQRSEEFCGLPTATARLPDGMNNPASVRATREQASNKLLYAAPVELDAPGDWKVHMLISRGTDTARFDCLVPVTMRSSKLSGMWPYLSLPLLAVSAFALNQWLRSQSLQKRP
ncbi:MAG TPA: hypothetical protein VLU94_02050 [Candidatus Nitrosotalea sp.]|nr:hypothetical protein [Candidatus Nitrosotalea sp.]